MTRWSLRPHSASDANEPRAPRPRGEAGDAGDVERPFVGRDGARVWMLLAAGVVAGFLAFRSSGLSWAASIACAIVAGAATVLAALGAWSQPERYTSTRLVRVAGPGFVLAAVAAVGAFLAVHAARSGGIAVAELPDLLATAARRGTPALLVLWINFVLLLWSVAYVRRLRLQEEVDALRLAQERDATARQLAEARLRLLQQQIEPHFIFNTLAAVQHWVDRADPRAGPLLRALTAFLRGSTEALTRHELRVDEELAIVRAYLTVMAARLGDRLRHAIDVDAEAGRQALPPGVILTLVENAIEHGIAPSLHGGTVAIDARREESTWTLRVADDGVGLASDWHDGVGLANCRERLAHRFGDAARLVVERHADQTVAKLTIDLAVPDAGAGA